MVWLKSFPKKPSSIEAALHEVRKAAESFRAKRQEVMDNECSLEYPRGSRVEKYEDQISCLDRVLSLLDDAISELRCYCT